MKKNGKMVCGGCGSKIARLNFYHYFQNNYSNQHFKTIKIIRISIDLYMRHQRTNATGRCDRLEISSCNGQYDYET